MASNAPDMTVLAAQITTIVSAIEEGKIVVKKGSEVEPCPFSEKDVEALKDMITMANRLKVLGWFVKWVFATLAFVAAVLTQWDKIIGALK